MAPRGLLIGIAGGTGSGKTMVADKIYEGLDSDQVVRICQDSYYHDLSHLTPKERNDKNFDHPDAVDSALLISQTRELQEGRSIEQPVYDFVRHVRGNQMTSIGPHAVIILEGILVLDNPELRDLMDIKIFVDTDADIRFIRRLKRDISERGRTLESVIEQYEESVRPMHLQFVEPSKRYADIIIPEGGHNLVAIDIIKTKISALLSRGREET